ncbi:glycosyltransferase [bacterium]|nr:glycosyltransferase [bacterium]
MTTPRSHPGPDAATSSRPLVLVEPLARGSRLQVAANAIDALRGRRPLVLVTRADYETDHFRELLPADPSTLQVVTAATDLGGAWTKILTAAEFRAFLAVLERLGTEHPDDYDLIFMALDDYLAVFARAGLTWRRRLKPRRVIGFKYRVDYLLPGPVAVRPRALRWLTHAALRWWHAELCVLDERLGGATAGAGPVHVLPDPWFGDFSPAHRSAARERYGWATDQFVVLALGRQDERKGFPLIMDAIPPLLTQSPNLALWVVGPVVDRLRSKWQQVRAQLGQGHIRHREDFVPDSELPLVLAAADAVLLPYAPWFTSSSGVLARAAAAGVPVVAAQHGLIGYHVERWQLGELFPTGSVPEFQVAISRLQHQRGSFDPSGLAAFAASCRLDVFQESWRRMWQEAPS